MGIFRFTMAFGTADDPGCIMPYYKVNQYDYWSGDRRSGYGYNTMVSLKDLPGLDKAASDCIADYPVSYKYCLNMSYNPKCVPGKGAALFLHCKKSGNTSTAGCVAIPESDMKYVITHVNPDCALIIDYVDRLKASDWFCCETLPENMTRIESGAFADCEGLKLLRLPETVTYIAEDAFDGCENLTLIVTKGSYAERRVKQMGIEYMTAEE